MAGRTPVSTSSSGLALFSSLQNATSSANTAAKVYERTALKSAAPISITTRVDSSNSVAVSRTIVGASSCVSRNSAPTYLKIVRACARSAAMTRMVATSPGRRYGL